ncbi:MAG: 3-dehydroquinate synthase [Verrucomicrobiota bacterium]|nr:3-dehydroquinate synthase [Verrucomicrobiota bacterium]
MNSEIIEINGDGFSYRAHVGRGLLARAGELLVSSATRVALIFDETSDRLFADTMSQSLRGFDCEKFVLPAGEKSKVIAEIERVSNAMVSAGCDRKSIVVGVGGGLVGDISGFIASIFQRGIPHVQVPTTLLAMVDSAIGGKNGVNLAAGKNMLGTTHQPALVIADVDCLASLPARELRQGYAEIIKHAIIRDAEMFRALQSGSANDWVALIARNIRIKAQIVSADAREMSGVRALLNFGHTVGHAIERASDYAIPHGDCVSLGIVAAAGVSVKCAGLASSERDEIIALLAKFDLPTRLPPNVSRAKIDDALRRDKKFEEGAVRFVVTPKIGEAQLSRDVTMADIASAMDRLR